MLLTSRWAVRSAVWIAGEVRLGVQVVIGRLGLMQGGTEAPVYRYPYMASLRDDIDNFCGAVLIYSNWALTAAHCLYPYDVVGRLFLSIGAHEGYYAPGTPGVEVIPEMGLMIGV